MSILILISIAVFLLVLGNGAAIWFVFRQRLAMKSREPVKRTTTRATLGFHRSYVILPVVILLLSVILTAYFYHRLPVEVAYHFKPDGSPDRWLSRGMIILWTLLPQLFLTLLAAAITWGIAKLVALFVQPESTDIKIEEILSLIGNMIGLPQIILCFAMLNIFSYNSYQIRILPLWIFALIIMGLGSIILGIFFIRAIWRVWVVSKQSQRSNK